MATTNDTTKVCTKCGEEKPATADFFARDNRKRLGFRSRCKTCSRQDSREQWQDIKQDPIRLESNYIRHRRYLPEWLKKTGKVEEERIRLRDYKRQVRLLPEWKEQAKRKRQERLAIDPVYREQLRANDRRRRARELQAEGSHTAQDILLQYKTQKDKCWWCSKSLGNTYHADHRIPLSRGGSNNASNIVLACAFCNKSKGGRMPYEWAGRLL